ncbi:hypothetical protein HN865_04755, partial [Candidatus Woesearchaeota archaeon]|nr:hypothetical protein [Candidatus Woesearchaeota archaeon]
WEFTTNLLSKIRQEKTKSKKAMNAECIITLDKKDFENANNLMKDFKNVTNAKEIKEGKFKVEFVD